MADVDLSVAYPALAALPPALRTRVDTESVALDVPAGTRIFATGELPRGFPLVLEGRVRVAKVGAQGRELALYRVGPARAAS